jgi:hypothetical protein
MVASPIMHIHTQTKASRVLLQRSLLLLVAYYVPYILIHCGMAKLRMVRASIKESLCLAFCCHMR